MSDTTDAPAVYECPECGQVFLEKCARGGHRATAHGRTETLISPAPFAKRYEDAEFLAAVEDLSLPLSRAVAERVGCHVSTARDRLNALRAAGEVTRETLDANDNGAYLWGVR